MSLKSSNALIQLSELDLKIDGIHANAAKLPHKAKVASIDLNTRKMTSIVSALEDGIAQLEVGIADLSKSITDANAHIALEQKKLDAGDLAYREVQAVANDIAHGSQRVAGLENEEIGLLEKKEAAKSKCSELTDQIAKLEELKAKVLSDYQRVRKEILAQIEDLNAQRSLLLADIEDQYLALYETARNTHPDAVGQFRRGRCTACSLKLPITIAAQFEDEGSVGVCSECRRVLVCLEGE